MDRVAAFIDGFNIYHSIHEHGCSAYKWLNYWSLAEAFISPKQERLVNVYYFSALAPWDTQKRERHKTYIRALEFYGCQVILGKFKKVTKKCHKCHQEYQTFEEKETDINIAVRMILEANKNSYDKALLFSGDSDMIAGVKALKESAPQIHVRVVIPYNRSSIDLVNNCHSNARIKRKHLEKNQLPERIELSPGSGKFIQRPPEWV